MNYFLYLKLLLSIISNYIRYSKKKKVKIYLAKIQHFDKLQITIKKTNKMIKLFSMKNQKKDQPGASGSADQASSQNAASKRSSAAQLRIQKG